MTVITVPAHVAGHRRARRDGHRRRRHHRPARRQRTTMSDVSEWMTAHGAPADWTGDASEAADHAMTRVARQTDGARAAFTRVAVACDKLRRSDRRAHQRSRRTRGSPDGPSTTRSTRSPPGSVSPRPTTSPASRARPRLSRARSIGWSTTSRSCGTTWPPPRTRLIAAFEAVDSTAEGQDAADRDTTDIGALRAELTQLGGDPDAINDWWKNLSGCRARGPQDQRPGPHRQHQRHPDRGSRRRQPHLDGPRPRRPPGQAGRGRGPEQGGAAPARPGPGRPGRPQRPGDR